MTKKKVLSVFLMMVMMFNTVFVIAVSAQANPNQDYTIVYSATNAGVNRQSAEIKITNNKSSDLEGWAIQFDVEGTIENLWGAKVYKHEGTQYILEAASYNLVIKPGQTATIGYTYISELNDEPQGIKMCAQRVTRTEGFEVAINKVNGWGNNSTCQLVISNLTDAPIRIWELTFDSNFAITEVWNAKKIKSEETTHTLKGSDNTNVIAANSSVTVGLVCQTLEEPIISNLRFSDVVYEYQTIEKSINLTASQTEIPVSNNSKLVYFYGETKDSPAEMMLVDADNTVIAEMKDDGLYSISGDDLQNDGVYSCKINIDATEEKTLSYYALAYVDESGNITVLSNELEIYIYNELTDDEIADMDATDAAIADLKASAAYIAMDLEQRIVAMGNLLDQLASEGKIIADSISFDEQEVLYSFSYSCEVLGGVMLKDFDDIENNTNDLSREYIQSDEPEDEQEYMIMNPTSTSTNVGEAVLLYAFDNTINSSRYPHYLNMQTQWNAKGLDTTLDIDVTVSDLKKLKGNEVIVFGSHGCYYKYKYGFLWLWSKTDPVLCLRENTSKSKDKQYSADLKKRRVIKVDGTYWVFPSLFTAAYGADDLKGSFVFSESCEFMGKNGNIDYSMSDALVSRGADALVGFHNSVYADYSRDMMKSYVDDLLEGFTAQAALDNAVTTYGATDVIWYYKQGYIGVPHSAAAYPILRGDGNATLVNTDIKNGSFELASTPSYWKTVGDVRVLSSLGDLQPQDASRMAILTTGIGSSEDDYLSGTEGSVMWQTFKVTGSKSTLTLSYNVVSEEPMEYVGSPFDDKFVVQLVGANGNVLNQFVYESINTSTWHPIGNINFEGGDDTVFHTGWKQVTVDISAYAGQLITLRFIVCDVGDSIFDTVALVDKISLS